MKRWIVYIVLLLGIASCGTLVYKRQITGNYYLIAVDSMEDLGVCYHNASDIYAGIGGHGVYEVGNDEHFIITKKYKEVPRTGRDSLFTTYDKSITEYCIIPIDNTQTWDAQDNFFGPLTRQEFETKRKELGVADHIVFKGPYSY